jgi:DNA invertase Pin-like site-specific DNA recombinase
MTQLDRDMDTLDYIAYTECVDLLRSLRRYAVKVLNPAAAIVWAFSYLRFSSPAQADGDSVRRQTALRDAWLSRHPEVRLDTSLRMVDAGVSGFRGEHRTNRKHALAAFLDLVERGRVPAGSYLIVENLDRLSREHPLEVLALVGRLVRAGVRVVQLAPECVFTADMDEGALCLLLLGSIRGHQESKRKSDMCDAAWVEKKGEARAMRKPHGKAVPAWLELTCDGYRVRGGAGRAVRLIFRWSAEGMGTLAIAARLNAERVPPIGRANQWNRSYVEKILDNRAVLGEYQPMKGHCNRVPDGDPVPGYFPAVVTEAEWHAAHAGKQARNRRSGRPGRKGDFLFAFSGMLRCALDRCPLHVITRKGKKYLVSARAVGGEAGAHWRPFPLGAFVPGVLGQLRELRAADLFADPGGAKVAELTGRLAEVDKRLAVALERFEADPESPTWSAKVTQYDREKRDLSRELAEARQEAANPLSGTWAEAVELMVAEDPARLRAGLLQTVEDVWCVFVSQGEYRLAGVEVFFQGGSRRDYLLLYRGPKGGAVRARAAASRCWSLADAVRPGDLDLRRPEDAAALERLLLAVDVERLLAGG